MARAGLLYIRVAAAIVVAFTLVWLLSPHTASQISDYTANAFAQYTSSGAHPRISYDITTPPGHSCPATVSRLQQQLFAAYQPILKDIRWVNIWGYLETGNKGDAAIWSAQQVLLSTFGVQTMEICRFIDKCNMTRFKQGLEDHKGHSAIIMAGGGNFNDYYWLDQPSRLQMTSWFHDFPIRAFPQSIYMTKPDKIKETIDVFSAHPNVQLAARDQPSLDWLEESFGPNEANGFKDSGVARTLTPDIVYAFGNRPDYLSTESPKKYDILINSRNDRETSHLNTTVLVGDSGAIKLGRHMVRWTKVNWDNTHVPGLSWQDSPAENERAFLRYDAGFKLHGEAELVVTDKLHGHIISTLIGVPHILLNSKLGKNLAYHDTWTLDCENTRIAENFEQTLEYATMFFEKEFREGRWTPSVEEKPL